MHAKSLIFGLLAAILLGGCSGQQLLYNATGAIYPGQGFERYAGLIMVPPGDGATGIVITLTSTPCEDAAGQVCSPTAGGNLVSAAHLELLCGNAVSVQNGGVPTFNSVRIDGNQTVYISPNSTNYAGASGQNATFTCDVRPSGYPRDFLPRPVAYTLSASTAAAVTLTDTEQASAAGLYKACCPAGSCQPWVDLANHNDPSATSGPYLDLCNMDSNLCNATGSLVYLNLEGYNMSCDLSTVNMSAFQALEYLYLGNNQLTGDFDTIAATLAADLPAIKELDLSYNPISGNLGSSNSSGTCTLGAGKLARLLLGNTTITGSLPPCFFKSGSTLRQLYGSNSQITGALPGTLGKRSAIEVLQIGGAHLSGPPPAEFSGTLIKVNLTANHLAGPMPGFTACLQLASVDLSFNPDVSGEALSPLVNHPTLRWVDLRDTQLSSLPAEWLDASQQPTNQPPLTYLYLSNTTLTGAGFPIGLQAYPNLTRLVIANASLGGDLPDVPANGFPALLYLDASDNALTGTVPAGWQHTELFAAAGMAQYELRVFALPNNSLSGALPDWLAQPHPNLLIDLVNNNFTNACDAAFATANACAGTLNPESLSPGLNPPPPAGGDSGLSGGAKGAIAIVVLLLIGGGVAFCLYRRRRAANEGRFTQFHDEGVELGRSNGLASSGYPAHGHGYAPQPYNPQLAP